MKQFNQNTAFNNQGKDLQKLLFKIWRNWHWFLLSVVLSGGIAYAYNRYTTPVYLIKSTLLIEEGKANSPLLGAQSGLTGDLFQGLGGMNSMKNIFNQMVILKSDPIVAKTIEELDFEVSYYVIGRVLEIEQYKKQVPFQVVWDEHHPQLLETDFFLTIHPDGKLEISVDEENASVYDYANERYLKNISNVSFTKQIEPGTTLTADEFSFTILLNEAFNPKNVNNYKFRFHSRPSLVGQYSQRLNVALTMQEASILELSIEDYNSNKGIDFLNKLIEVYQLDNLNLKNENANRTIQFISSQLQNISDSLDISENRMENFQSTNQVLDISVQSQQLLEQMNELDKEKVAMETQNKYYRYLKDYIQNNHELETIIAPSAMGIDDPLLNSLILQLNELINRKSSQTSIRQDSKHPMIVRLNAQIESVKGSLLENISNIISQSDIALEDLNNRIRRFEIEIRRLPVTERNFVNIERTYKLNNETYNFLLQKLSEAQIAKASNIPDSRVIGEARNQAKVKPQEQRIYMLGLLLGLAFPALVLFLHDLFNTKIVSQDDIKAITKYPIVGHIFYNKTKTDSRTLVLDNPNSPASEPFRAIRNKLNLMTKGKAHPVIAVLSAYPMEGKSYNAINIASSFALMRKKTVLLDLDLRNSKMAEEFQIKSDLGVVNYIIGKASTEEILFDTKHPNLKIIPAGPIPPNPSEMLTDKRLFELVEYLQENFDVVIIDSPPVGSVADLFQLHEIIDTNLFVVRHRYTNKQGLKIALEEVAVNKLKGVGIIVNNIRRGKKSSGFGSGYGYGYAYGYGYGYGKNKKNSNRNWLEVENQTRQSPGEEQTN